MKTIKRVFRVNRRDIEYLRYTIESYSGMAVVSTLDPYVAYIEIQIPTGCEDVVSDLLKSLINHEGLDILEIKQDT